MTRPPVTVPRWRVTEDEAGSRLDKFLASPNRLGSRGRVVAALDRGRVFVNDVESAAADGSSRVAAGDDVCVWIDRPGTARRRPDARKSTLRIVFEDDDLIVLDKPAGLLSVPLDVREAAASIFEQVEDHLRRSGKRRPLVVHRIDRDTSGLVVFGKHAAAQRQLKNQFRRREPERIYWAVVYGCPDPPSGTWRDRLVWDERASIQKETGRNDPNGLDAIADYRVVERFATTSLVEVRLETGKRNQIRIQARLRGHTLVGEKRYVFGPDNLRPLAFPRHALHAYRLAFRHPSDGRLLRFEAPVPDDLAALFKRLRQGAGP
ncbi:MAG TPA: RluA family pseudouridine synthase [Vicinamibacterales bacterium]|jgi:23S rRNA pseudouridine1911/1915/1917 synthase|nr:RluA family pseudouridine synthase [Vicinamibacterales bacterium]